MQAMRGEGAVIPPFVNPREATRTPFHSGAAFVLLQTGQPSTEPQEQPKVTNDLFTAFYVKCKVNIAPATDHQGTYKINLSLPWTLRDLTL